MKKITLLLLFMLIFSGCKKEVQSFPEINIPEETSVVVSLAKSVEEEIAQSMERATNYKIDVLDVRLLRDNELALPLMPGSGFPTIVFIIQSVGDELLTGDELLNPVEEQLNWEAAKAGIRKLAGSDGVTGFHYFFTYSGVLQSGIWCPATELDTLQVSDSRSCIPWPGIAPLPPEMTRFIGF